MREVEKCERSVDREVQTIHLRFTGQKRVPRYIGSRDVN